MPRISVNLETGELWGHTGDTFRRLSEAESADVAYVARLASGAQGSDPDDQAVQRSAATGEHNAIRDSLAALVGRYDDHELRPLLAELVAEIDARAAR